MQFALRGWSWLEKAKALLMILLQMQFALDIAEGFNNYKPVFS